MHLFKVLDPFSHWVQLKGFWGNVPKELNPSGQRWAEKVMFAIFCRLALSVNNKRIIYKNHLSFLKNCGHVLPRSKRLSS